jgi:hypothetical protein
MLIEKDKEGNLTHFCKEGSMAQKPYDNVFVGSYVCTDLCPCRIFRIGQLVFCTADLFPVHFLLKLFREEDK